MRDIRVRAWDKKNGKWVHEELEELGEEFELMWMDMEGLAVQHDGSPILLDECGRYVYLDRERFIVSLFTGLLDRTGREIWEGDILLTPGGFKMEVKIDNIGYGDPKFFNIGFEVCEVIGNIWEHPELLE